MNIPYANIIATLTLIFGVIGSAIAWQLEQDQKLANQKSHITELKMMVEQQKELMKLQQETHRREIKMRGLNFSPESIYGLESSPARMPNE